MIMCYEALTKQDEWVLNSGFSALKFSDYFQSLRKQDEWDLKTKVQSGRIK
jgi:hypothetical protein